MTEIEKYSITSGVNIYRQDAVKWADAYDGEPYHALFCDAPYHLTAITKRFGKPDSAPAKFGEDGIYKRFSTGFMGEEWDGGGVAFDPNTWLSFKKVLYPGAFGMAYAGCRTYHKMATAIESAGFIIHPAIAYIGGQGFPKATRIDNQIDATEEKDRWSAYRYGMQALKPAMEMICVFQKPYEVGKRPVDQIINNGAGALWIDGGRIAGDWKWGTQTDIRGGGYNSRRPSQGDVYANNVIGDSRWPANVLFVHTPECNLIGFEKDGYVINRFDDGAKPWGKGAGHNFTPMLVEGYRPVWDCSENCPLRSLTEDQRDYFYQGGWIYEQFKYDKKPSVAEKTAGMSETDKYAHPSYKPILLNRHLAALLLPPAEYKPRLFVPFSGVASEMIGAILAGWRYVDGVEIDLNNKYIPVAKERLVFWAGWVAKGLTDPEQILRTSQTEKIHEETLKELGLEQKKLLFADEEEP